MTFLDVVFDGSEHRDPLTAKAVRMLAMKGARLRECLVKIQPIGQKSGRSELCEAEVVSAILREKRLIIAAGTSFEAKFLAWPAVNAPHG
jgi:hypothetical protein